MKVKTEKWHILYVLQDGVSKNTHAISEALAKNFHLKPRLNTLRKNLERCLGQGVVEREKSGGSYCYRITARGKKRLDIVKAKIVKEYETVPALRKVQDVRKREKIDKSFLLKRVFEVVSSLRLCDALLNCSADKRNSNLAATAKMYWQIKYVELIPYVAEEFGKAAEQLFERI